MLENQPPPEGEDYGPWMPQMTRLLQAFKESKTWGVHTELARMWHAEEGAVSVLVYEAENPAAGMTWYDFLDDIWLDIEEEDRKERRMRERLARTTGDSMADEILAMLREQELSRTDIYRRYSRNVSAERINDALFVLERLGWARWKTVSTGERGREVWYLPPDED